MALAWKASRAKTLESSNLSLSATLSRPLRDELGRGHHRAAVAQLAEHRLGKADVLGSNPSGGSTSLSRPPQSLPRALTQIAPNLESRHGPNI